MRHSASTMILPCFLHFCSVCFRLGAFECVTGASAVTSSTEMIAIVIEIGRIIISGVDTLNTEAARARAVNIPKHPKRELECAPPTFVLRVA